MSRSARDGVDPVDGSILATLSMRSIEYPAVLAHEFGLTLATVVRRCQNLADRKFVERVTEEPLYRVTVMGRQYLKYRRGPSPMDGPK